MRLTFEKNIEAATALGDGSEDVYGNTYRFEAMIEGKLVNGLVEGSEMMKTILAEEVEVYNEKDLTEIFEDPSCLSLAIAVAKKLAERLSGFHSLRVWEGPHRWVELNKAEALAASLRLK